LFTLFGGTMLAGLTQMYWTYFLPNDGAPVGPGVVAFTLPRGLLLGAVTGYVLELAMAGRVELAGRISLFTALGTFMVFGLLIVADLVTGSYDHTVPYWNLTMAWNAFTLLWTLILLLLGMAFLSLSKMKAPRV